jgi:hypothetical protein
VAGDLVGGREVRVDATSGIAAVWFWLAIVVLFVAVIPILLLLATRLLNHALEIRRYADDILEHGVGITANLEPVPALLDTQRLVKSVGDGLLTYASVVDQLLGRRP